MVSGYCYLFSCKSGNSAAFLHEEGENNTLFPHPTSPKKKSKGTVFFRDSKNFPAQERIGLEHSPAWLGLLTMETGFCCLLFALVAVGRTKNAENKEGTLRTHKISRAKSLFRPKSNTAKHKNRRLLFLSGSPGPVPLPSGTGDFFDEPTISSLLHCRHITQQVPWKWSCHPRVPALGGPCRSSAQCRIPGEDERRHCGPLTGRCECETG